MTPRARLIFAIMLAAIVLALLAEVTGLRWK